MKFLGGVSLCLLLSSFLTLAQSNPVPFVNQPLVPMTVAPGGPGFTLTVNGTEFVSGAVVNWNGTALTTTFVTGSQLTAAVPASDVAAAGTASVTVTNPPPGGGVSNVMYFGVTNPAASLAFSSLYSSSPGSGYSMITADFNGDGKLDLASLSLDPNMLVVALGNGDGTFQAPSEYPTGNQPEGLVATDFNGDGKLDVAVTNHADNTVSVFLGNGDGTFQAARTFATGPSPTSIAAADFNGDGKLDLAVNVGGSIAILLGNGDGTFQAPTYYAPGEEAGVDGMAVGDFNGDGKQDIALSCYSSVEGPLLFVLLGNGDGTFQVSSGVSMGLRGTQWMLAADVNGDGKLDLVFSLQQQFTGIEVLLGNGDGTFRQGGGAQIGTLSLGVVAGDFNADGKLDLAAAAFTDSGSGVGIALGNGDGTFQDATIFPTATGSCGECFSEVLVAGDFNGDGQTDLAATIINPGISLVDNLQVLLQGNYAALASIPSSVVFAQQNVGTSSAPQSVTVTNTGNSTYNISSIGVTGANAGDFSQNNTCGAVLAANASCQVNVTFTPRQAGVRNAGLSVTGNSFPLSVPLNGTGVGTVASLSPPTVTFPAQYVGTSGLPQTVMLSNTGGGLLTITSVTASPADFAPLSTCGNSLAPGASCSIGVFFDPTTSGTRSGTLTVVDSANNSPQVITLTGNGQDFSMTSSGSSSATVSPGGTANYTLTIAPAGGFKGTVSFICSGGPPQSTCSVPSSVTLNGSSATTVSVTVNTAATSAGLMETGGWNSHGWPAAIWLLFAGLPGLVVMSVGSFGQHRLRRLLLQGLVVLCLVSVVTLWAGCGGGGGGAGNGGTSYNLTVTGSFTSGATKLTHTTVLTLIVQ